MPLNEERLPQYARRCVQCPRRLTVECYGVRRYTRTTGCIQREPGNKGLLKPERR